MDAGDTITEAVSARDRRRYPVMTVKDIEYATGLSNSNIKRWLNGDAKWNKVGLVDQGKIIEYRLGVDPKAGRGEEARGFFAYTMPEDKVIRGIPTASSSNIGTVLHKYEDFGKTCAKWRSITFGFTLIYLLIRLTAGKDLIDEFSVWGFIIVCTLLIAEGYVSQLFRGYHDPPEDIYHSLKVAINMFSITSGVATVGMIYIILTYFEWASGTAVVTAVAVVVFEAFSVAGAGVSAKVHFEMASKVIK